MKFTFLQEEIETILLFATAPIYFAIVGIVQTQYLKILDKLKRKKLDDTEKKQLLKKIRKLKKSTPLFMLIGASIHIIAYVLLEFEELRFGYFISISIMYCIYVLIAWINFYLKGAGILKDIGNFNGLPGN